MLDIIKKLDAGTIRGLIAVTIPLLVLIASKLGIDQAVFEAKLNDWGEWIALVVASAGVAWAGYARLFNPTPPITETAKRKTEDMISTGKLDTVPVANKQGGFAQVSSLIGLVGIVGTILLASMSGCAGTLSAYKEAKGDVEKTSFVALNHYESLQEEAIKIKAKPGTSADVIEAMKKADAAAFPIAEQVRDLQVAYRAVQDSGNAEALQAAVDKLVLLLSDMITANKRGRD